MPFLTGDSTPTPVCCSVYIPDDVNSWAVFLGIFYELCKPENWQQFGTKTPEETAQNWIDAMGLTFPLEPCEGNAVTKYPGEVFFYAGLTIPDDCLLCDGEEYNASEYPTLFDAIGYTFGGSAGVFNVPDMSDRFVLSAIGETTLGQIGGYDEITLSVANLPPHEHNLYESSASGASQKSVVTGTKTLSSFATQQTGSGTPHSNIPPFIGLIPVIYAG